MSFKGAVLDVDGTVLRGDRALPGADAGVDTLERADIDRLYVTNNPTHSPEGYARRLLDMGIESHLPDVLTSGRTTARWINQEYPDAPVHVIGEAGLSEQLRSADIRLVSDPSAAAVVVASIDREFDYDRLCEALWTLSDPDVAFIGTDPDTVIPGDGHNLPGSGAIINAIANVTGREPETVLGKPSEPTRRHAADRLGVPLESCLVVGDRLDTDIALGNRAGMTTVLVRTGVSGDQDLADSDITPDYVLDSIAEIDSVLAN